MNTGSAAGVLEDKMPVKWSFSSAEKKEHIRALTLCLRELRETAGVTQGDLAEIAGVSRQTYGSIELKKREMSWNTYMSLIFFFDYIPYTHGMLRQKGLFDAAFDDTARYRAWRVQREPEAAECRDLFEDVRQILGLDYVSDMRFASNLRRVIAVLKVADLRKYSLTELSDMANYINGHTEPFTDYESAGAFFAGIS